MKLQGRLCICLSLALAYCYSMGRSMPADWRETYEKKKGIPSHKNNTPSNGCRMPDPSGSGMLFVRSAQGTTEGIKNVIGKG